MTDDGGRLARDPVLDLLRFGGVLLMLGVGAVHLFLWYHDGYRHIPTIGNLFLVQVVLSVIAGGVVAVTPRWYVAAAGSLFGLGTMAGYEAFRTWTIFGFHEVRTTAGFTAGALEVLAFVSLGGYAVLAQQRASVAAALSRRAPVDRVLAATSGRVAAVGGVVAVLLVILVGVTAVPARRTTGPTAAQAGVTIVIKDFAFVPSTLTVRPGEVIRVENEDAVAHTLTALPGSSPQGHFDTGELVSGGTTTITAPTAPGTYKYDCSIHTFMTGTLTVS
jgi:plastocyanin